MESRNSDQENSKVFQLQKLSKVVRMYLDSYFKSAYEKKKRTVYIEKNIINNYKKLLTDSLEQGKNLDLIFKILSDLIYIQDYRVWVCQLIESNLKRFKEDVETSDQNLLKILRFLDMINNMVLKDLLETEIRDEISDNYFYKTQKTINTLLQQMRPFLFAYLKTSNKGLPKEKLLEKFRIIRFLYEKEGGTKSSENREKDILTYELVLVILHLVKVKYFGNSLIENMNIGAFLENLSPVHKSLCLIKLMEFLNLGKDAREVLIRYSRHSVYDFLNELKVIQDLEFEKSGITSVLFEKFGIRYFSRYPKSLLIKQFNQMNDKNLRYGIFVSGLPDSSKAFSNEVEIENLLNISKQLDGINFGIRFIEVGSIFEMDGILENLNDFYGNENKIEFMFLRAHANVNMMMLTLTHNDEEDIILGNKTSENLLRKWKTSFSENFKCVLDGCSVGKKKRGRLSVGSNGGMAQWLSQENLFGNVIAPPGVESGIQSTTISLERDEIMLSSKYNFWAGKQDKRMIVSENGRVYKNGRAV